MEKVLPDIFIKKGLLFLVATVMMVSLVLKGTEFFFCQCERENIQNKRYGYPYIKAELNNNQILQCKYNSLTYNDIFTQCMLFLNAPLYYKFQKHRIAKNVCILFRMKEKNPYYLIKLSTSLKQMLILSDAFFCVSKTGSIELPKAVFKVFYPMKSILTQANAYQFSDTV